MRAESCVHKPYTLAYIHPGLHTPWLTYTLTYIHPHLQDETDLVHRKHVTTQTCTQSQPHNKNLASVL